MSYQYIEVRYPTGKYIGETGHTNGKVFWDDIFHNNIDLSHLPKEQLKEIAKHRLRQFLSIYQKVPEYIECPVCRQHFAEPDWDEWFIDGNHDLCPSCLFQYGQLTPKEQSEFQAKYQGVVI